MPGEHPRDPDSDQPRVPDDQSEPVDDEAIRRRAYEIYERRGAGEGRDQDDWVQAERDLRAPR